MRVQKSRNETTSVGGGSPSSRKAVVEEAVATTAAVELDARAQRLVERTVAHINRLVGAAGGSYEEIADHLFEEIFDGDELRALGPAGETPAAFQALLKKAETDVHLSATQLKKAARIGALNRHLASTGWKELSWSLKVELLPLLGADRDVGKLDAGVRQARKKGIGVRALREWVAARRAGEVGDADGETIAGPTLATGRAAIRKAAAFGKASDRRQWIDRVRGLPEAHRQRQLVELRAAARHLQKLAEELESALAGD